MQVYTDETIVEFGGDYAEFGHALQRLVPYSGVPLPRETDPWWDTSDVQPTIVRLLDLLNAKAPEGYYFGAHPEQPECFGYWKQGLGYVEQG